MAKALPPCDVFVGLSGMAVRSAEVARSKYGAKIIIDRGCRHVLSQNDLASAGGGACLTDFYIRREVDSYARADYIALPSTHAVESFIERGFADRQLFRNPYGVDFGRFSSAPSPGPPLKLLFVGAWSHQKGADVLSAALDRTSGCTLTHAGMRVDVPYPSGGRFKALGHVPSQRLPEVFAGHHVLVLPSRVDGFGMVLLEALASGLSVIASRMTGGPDIRDAVRRKESVRLVEPGSVDELAAAIQEAAKNVPPKGTARAVLSDAEREHFTWQAYAERYAGFMRAVV